MWVNEQGCGVQGAAIEGLSCASVLLLKLVVTLRGGLSCRLAFTILQRDIRQACFLLSRSFLFC